MAMLPKLKLKALVSFPSNVYGGTGIEVVKANGNFTINLDYTEFAFSGTLPPGSNVLVWDPISDNYVLVPPSATSGITDAPSNSKMYGRFNGAWVDAWASPALTGNPTAPTPAVSDNDTSIATTAFVTAAVAAGGGGVLPATATPLVESGAGAVGISLKYAREDHVHPVGASGSGDVVGPAGAAPDHIAVYDGVTGKIIKDGGATIASLLFVLPTVTTITASTTYTPPATCSGVLVMCKGGGGSGGGSASGTVNGGGGGEGGITYKYLTRAAAAGQTVTIGAGGAAVAVATNVGGNNGGSTTFGALCVANGGSGGTQGNFGGGGGAGGPVGTSDYGFPGIAGDLGADKTGSVVGINAMGGGRGGGNNNTPGQTNSGGGGGCGSTAGASGAGGSGICIITEFY